MNDCRFSCKDLLSVATLSLRSTSLILFRFSDAVKPGADLEPKVERVPGRGKSEARVDNRLVPLVLADARLLSSMTVDMPILLRALRWLRAPLELCLGSNTAPPVSIPSPTLCCDCLCCCRCFSRFSARLLGDMSTESCLDDLAISVGTEKLSCGV